MVTLPVVTLYAVWYVADRAKLTVFGISDSLTIASGAAILMVNLVIASYVYVAYHEDDDEGLSQKEKRDKYAATGGSEPPRVGFNKLRTD
jgi:hypothetical protein